MGRRPVPDPSPRTAYKRAWRAARDADPAKKAAHDARKAEIRALKRTGRWVGERGRPPKAH
jgi:hypothetical protein